MSLWNDKFIFIEQTFVTFSSSPIDIGTEVSLAIFLIKEYNVATKGSLDTVKQSDSVE